MNNAVLNKTMKSEGWHKKDKIWSMSLIIIHQNTQR